MKILIYFSIAFSSLCVVYTEATNDTNASNSVLETEAVNIKMSKETKYLGITPIATAITNSTQDETIISLEITTLVPPTAEIFTDSEVVNSSETIVTTESNAYNSSFEVEDDSNTTKIIENTENATETAIEAPNITAVEGSIDLNITETELELNLKAQKTKPTTIDVLTDPKNKGTKPMKHTETQTDLEVDHNSTGVNISTEVMVETTETEVISNVICQFCECSNREVNCSNHNLLTPFEMTDWDALIDFKPLSVDLSQNPWSTLSRISNVTTLRYLNISNCKIETIESATFSYLRELVSLDLTGNMLATSSVNRRVFVGVIDPKVGILPFLKLRYLSLANNDIHSLAQDIFAFMPGLTTLDLSGNPLGFIDQVTMGAITDLEDLRELKLNGCKLQTLPPGMFRRHHRLKRLDLSNNKFTTVPACLSEAVSLEYLDFGMNPVEIFNGTNPISSLNKLKELHLNRLPKLQVVTDGALSELMNLEILELSFNPKLTQLEDEFLMWTDEHTEQEMWPPLRELYLNNNNLSRIYSGYLERWDLLSRFDLSNNPYLCDCSNQWIVDVLVPLARSSPSNSTLGNMICKKPKEMKGVTFVQLNNASKVLACPEQDLNMLPAPDMAILLGIIIGMFVTFPLVLVVVLLWRRGTFARCRSKRIDSDSEEEETDAF